METPEAITVHSIPSAVDEIDTEVSVDTSSSLESAAKDLAGRLNAVEGCLPAPGEPSGPDYLDQTDEAAELDRRADALHSAADKAEAALAEWEECRVAVEEQLYEIRSGAAAYTAEYPL